jgi:hypothetical protein
MFRLLLLSFLLASPAICFSEPAVRRFDLKRDAFAFSNDTAFAYGIDEQGKLKMSLRKDKPEFSHSCFLMIRACLQFWKFARFQPNAARLPREEYHKKVDRLFKIPAWSCTAEKIEFPGFAGLHDFSRSYEGLLKEDMGNWVLTYFRPGNWRLMLGHPRSGQAFVANWMVSESARGNIPAIYLSKFPEMNHAVLVISAKNESNGDITFKVYDVNYPKEPANLRFVAARQSFDFERRWYFPGGQVNAMRIYLSPMH